MSATTYLLFVVISLGHANVFHECSRLFNPQNYLHQLPSLSLPYVDSVPIPSQIVPLIKPSPVITTKVISIVTKYVARNPMCVKVTGNKPKCRSKGHSKNGFEYLVTKEYFVKDPEDYEQRNLAHDDDEEEDEEPEVEASENARAFIRVTPTPILNPSIRHILIEDRLDHLQEILPYYTRRKTYETSTITVTKVRNVHKVTATLVVKNCVPAGVDVCPPNKKKRRKSKVGNFSNITEQFNEFFG